MPSTIGILHEFGEGENWTEFTERLDQYFLANDINDTTKKRAVLLTVCGGKTYGLMKNLLSPEKPTDKSYEDLVKLIKEHQQPEPSVIVSRYKFHTCTREADMPITDYVAVLRKLADKCDFGITLNDMLRDRLVIGVNDDRIQRRLLSETKLDYKRAEEIARSMQLASKNLQDINASQKSNLLGVHKFQGTNTKVGAKPKHSTNKSKQSQASKQNAGASRTCYRCLGTNHRASGCPFLDAECHFCHKRGHIKKACRKRAADKNHSTKQETNVLNNDFDSSYSAETYTLFYGSSKRVPPILVKVEMEDKPVTMEIDTGAGMSIISQSTVGKLWGDKGPAIVPTQIQLRTYTGEEVKVLGQIRVKVRHGDTTKHLPLLVVANDGPTLFGRVWLEEIPLQWKEVHAVNNLQGLKSVRSQYAEVFQEGTYKGPKVKLYVESDAKPKFYKARPVPFMYREKIECELER